MAGSLLFMAFVIVPALIVGQFMMVLTSHFMFSLVMGMLIGLPMSVVLIYTFWGRPPRRTP